LTVVLVRADHLSQQRAAPDKGKRISERDVLEALTVGAAWAAPTQVKLPGAAELRSWLAGPQRGAVDDNGRLLLDFLDSGARKTLEAAHSVAQQRGLCPIPHRLACAAFLADPRGAEVNRLLRRQGVIADELGELLVAMAIGKSPATFALGPEATSGVVERMLQRARELAGPGKVVSEAILFRAFCLVAEPEFKKMLLALPRPWRLDLDTLSQEKPPPFYPQLEPYSERLTDSGWNAVIRAAELARQSGWKEIRTPHLFVAMLNRRSSTLASALREKHVDPDKLRKDMLSKVGTKTHSRSEVPLGSSITLSENARLALDRAIAAVGAEGRSSASLADLLVALCADEKGIVAKVLAEHGIVLRRSRTG
jgi:hypothetical protein